MTDGGSEAIEYYKGVFDGLMESNVRYYESFAAADRDETLSATRVIAQMTEKHKELFCTKTFIDAIGFKCAQAAKILARGAKRQSIFSVEELLILLHYSSRFTKLIRLQKASQYGEKLLLFFDDEDRLTPNGVYFQNPACRFTDGDQYILLGIAMKKHRMTWKKNVPHLIVATRYYARRKWRFERLIEWDVEDVIQD